MLPPRSPEDIEALARKRTKAKLGWWFHLAAFVCINAVVFAMSRYAFGTRPWSVYPLLGWGVGVALHGVSVFVLGSGSALHERMLQREREALQRQQTHRDAP